MTAYSLRLMTSADLAAGLRLSRQNGWNQLEADWRRQLDLDPDGCFLAEKNGAVVGSACGCVFGAVAWVALVLVDEQHRGQGIGTALVERVIDYLDSRGVRSIRLDATAVGRPVYLKLGFQDEFSLDRHEGTLPMQAAAPNVEAVTASDVDAIVNLDRDVTGTDRGPLLRRLFEENPEEFREVRGPAGIEGYLCARPGYRAWQIGPCLGGATACRALLLDACRRHAGAHAFIDIPRDNPQARALAEKLGLGAQRRLLRMGRGPRIAEDLARFWSSFGPEKG